VEPNVAPEQTTKRAESAVSETRDGGLPSSEKERNGPSRRRRNLLSFGLFFLAMSLVVGIVGVYLYDRATKIDRGTPVVAVFQYIDAIFDQRDLHRAQLFECDKANGRAALQTLLGEIEERERQFDIRMTVSAGDFVTAIEGPNAKVDASLFIDAPESNGETSRSNQPWTFTLKDENGWRVCSAQRVP